jgi:hypothetical protein
MRKIVTTIAVLLLVYAMAMANEKPQWAVYMQQGGIFYTSDHLISAGLGVGVGGAFEFKNYWIGKTDINLYWLNGNAVSGRLAVGIQKPGKWSPAFFVGGNLIGGEKTKVILPDNRLPSSVRFVSEITIAPLRFKNQKGFVSVCEIGAGMGTDKGMLIEISLLSVGINF